MGTQAEDHQNFSPPKHSSMASSSSVVTTGYGVKLAKEAWGVPGDISPVIYSFQVQAMSADGLTCVFPVAFTIDPRADRHAKVISAAVDELVKGVLEETRALARSMTKEQIFHGDSAEWFKKELFKSVQMKLDQFGLTINANMKQPGDGYLSYLGQEPEALAQAKVGVAETPANGEVGAMEREGMALHNTAEGSKEEAEVQVFKIKRDEEAGEASVEELAMKKARLERLPRVAEVELVKAERQTEKLIMAENLAVGGQQANWELYNNQQKATEARLFELEKQAGARPRKRDKAAMGEAQSAYFNLNLGDKNKNTHRHRHRGLVDRRSDEEAVGEEASQNLKSATVGGKLLEAAIESTAEVSEVHDNSDDRDLEAGLGSIAQMVTPGASKEQLARALLMVSHASLFFGVSAGVRQPATTGSIVARHQAAYYGLVAAILAAVPVEMATAFYLRRSNNRRFHAFAQGLRGVGVVLLITVAAVGGFVLTKA